jgi:YHS domain-containing protein
VPVKVHVDTAPQLAERFGVEGWPTDLILTAAGLEVTRMISPKLPADYALMLEQVAIQTGTGASRGRDNPQFVQARTGRHNVALTAATTPMGSQSVGTPPQPSAGPTAGSTAPGRPTPYDPHEAALSPAKAPPVANPFAGPAPTQRYAAPRVPQQAATAAAPNTAAFLQDAAARSPATVPLPTTSATAPHAPAPSGRSIYDDPPEQSSIPSQSRHTPPPSAGLPTNRQPGPPTNVYDPAALNQRQQRPAAPPQMPPQVSQQRSVYPPPAQASQPAQPASAQFRSPQFVEVSKAPPAAIDAFCPVTILESGRWHKGNVQFGAVHGGRTYLFASEQAQQKFLANPQRYAPVLSGCDPVVFAETHQLIDGNHNIGMLIGEKTFFFTSEETRKRFELSPHVYMARAQQAMSAGQSRAR